MGIIFTGVCAHLPPVDLFERAALFVMSRRSPSAQCHRCQLIRCSVAQHISATSTWRAVTAESASHSSSSLSRAGQGIFQRRRLGPARRAMPCPPAERAREKRPFGQLAALPFLYLAPLFRASMAIRPEKHSGNGASAAGAAGPPRLRRAVSPPGRDILESGRSGPKRAPRLSRAAAEQGRA